MLDILSYLKRPVLNEYDTQIKLPKCMNKNILLILWNKLGDTGKK